jgi:hypothetical protein
MNLAIEQMTAGIRGPSVRTPCTPLYILYMYTLLTFKEYFFKMFTDTQRPKYKLYYWTARIIEEAIFLFCRPPVLEFLNNLWGLGTD